MDSSSSCSKVLCSFVDTFVDFCVSDGIFLPPAPPVDNTNENVFQTSPPDRLIALGDLHGDLPKTKESLNLAGLIDSENNWSGGSSTLVQIGDVLDRGGDELKILYFLEKLRRQAVKDHGNVITMNGNHEILNVDADFRYVTPAALDEFNHWAFWFNIEQEEMDSSSSCSKVLCSFVDTFVDFCVSDGIFLPPAPPVNNTNENVFQTSPPDRLIALGDLHGDLPKTKESLSLAGLIDSENNWSGGSSTLVQIGDVLDRGGDELKILYFLEKLRRQAVKDHGNVITMNGNHEILNVDADFRYVTPAALDEFNHWAFWFNIGSNIKNDNSFDLFHGIPENLKN
nr:shewanella-like protein phosphatase 2 [Tanacetum cinerariifolium]